MIAETTMLEFNKGFRVNSINNNQQFIDFVIAVYKAEEILFDGVDSKQIHKAAQILLEARKNSGFTSDIIKEILKARAK